MGTNDSDSDKGSLWHRALVIFFGLCIVAIGAHPLQSNYGGVVPFIKKHSTALAKEISGNKGEKGGKSSARLKTNTLANTKEEKNQSKSAPASEHKSLDRLDSTDRKALNNLIDNL